MWRDSLERCIRLETEQAAALRALIATCHDPERLRSYAEMLAQKVEVLTLLNQLLRYGERGSD